MRMSAIAKITTRLAKHPEIRSAVHGAEGARTITLHPSAPDGFAVSLTESPGLWTVGFEGWHEEFRREEEALECFAFGLSAECRLRVEYRGRAPVKWTLEALADGKWVEDSTTGLFHPFFWRRPQVRYLQNKLLLAEPVSPLGTPAT
jgi:hypothetical protein